MKDIFPEYYQPDGETFEALWNQCLFIVDANVILDLYRYSEESRNDLFAILENEKIEKRLWLPHQVAYEFQKNRLTVILSKRDSFLRVERAFTEGIDNLIQNVREKADEFNRVNKLRKEPLFDTDEIFLALRKEIDEIKQKLEREREKILDHQDRDIIRERIDRLFNGKVGQQYAKDELVVICEEGKKRFEKSIPPGYIDYPEKVKSKPADSENMYNQFGDFLVWKQIIDKSKATKTPIIFVTGDVKEDWFERIKGKTVSPRPELIREMKEEAGTATYIYPIDTFYRYAKEYLEQETRQETVQEVAAILETREAVLETRKESLVEMNFIQKFYEDLPLKLKAFLRPAQLTYSSKENSLTIFYSKNFSFHFHQTLINKQELLKVAQELFGNDITVELWEDFTGVPSLAATLYDTDTSPFNNQSRDVIKEELSEGFWKNEPDSVHNNRIYKGGEKVKHPRFGIGTVVGISGEGSSAEITIIFKDAGAKRLSLKFANLTKI